MIFTAATLFFGVAIQTTSLFLSLSETGLTYVFIFGCALVALWLIWYLADVLIFRTIENNVLKQPHEPSRFFRAYFSAFFLLFVPTVFFSTLFAHAGLILASVIDLKPTPHHPITLIFQGLQSD